MTEAQWIRAPFCCICGSRRSQARIEELKGIRSAKYYTLSGYSDANWLIEMPTDTSPLMDWPVYRFCSDSCLEMFRLNPLAYENRASYIV